MEDVGIFYGHLVHFMVFCYTLWTFGTVRGNMLYIFPFWYFVPRKIWQPCFKLYFRASEIVLLHFATSLRMIFCCHPCQLYAATRHHEVTRSGFLLYVGSLKQTIISGQVALTLHQVPDTVYSITMLEIRTG
jgi:hypothetical protein